MPWEVSLPEDEPIVEIVYVGVVPARELADASGEAVERGLTQGRDRMLVDCRSFEGGHSREELETLARALSESGVGAHFREAVVYSPGTPGEAGAQVWSELCQALSLDVRIFPDRTEALAWLLAG